MKKMSKFMLVIALVSIVLAGTMISCEGSLKKPLDGKVTSAVAKENDGATGIEVAITVKAIEGADGIAKKSKVALFGLDGTADVALAEEFEVVADVEGWTFDATFAYDTVAPKTFEKLADAKKVKVTYKVGKKWYFAEANVTTAP